jgi:hypothetical protein
MPSAATASPVLVTKDELLEIADWERKYAAAKNEVSRAERELKHLRQSLAEKVLGIESPEELKILSPDEVESLFEKRFDAGKWKLQRGSPNFRFVKTSEGRYPAWKQEFINVAGQSAADKISALAPTIYSYLVQIAAP